VTDASLASGASVDTSFPRLILPQSTQREFDATTSPRLGSRLARRPKEQFPYSMQPFQILPPAPGAQQVRLAMMLHLLIQATGLG